VEGASLIQYVLRVLVGVDEELQVWSVFEGELNEVEIVLHGEDVEKEVKDKHN
jgi:predicted RNA-binding protein YlqC (UPF0109 family)